MILRKAKNCFLVLLRVIFLLFVVVISVAPILWVVLSSFKSNAEIVTSALALPKSFSFASYAKALNTAPILKYYGNSIIISIVGTVVNVMSLAMAAYVFARLRFRGKNLIFFLFSMTLFLPVTSLILPIYLVMKELGLTDTRLGLMLVYAALGLPTSLMVLRTSFLSLPVAVEESAYVDGANFFTTFFKIALPSAVPGLASAAVLQFLFCWNEFQFALILTTKSSVRTLPLALNYFVSQFSYDRSAQMAAVVMVVIPSVILYILLNKKVVSGLSSGAVKD